MKEARLFLGWSAYCIYTGQSYTGQADLNLNKGWIEEFERNSLILEVHMKWGNFLKPYNWHYVPVATGALPGTHWDTRDRLPAMWLTLASDH